MGMVPISAGIVTPVPGAHKSPDALPPEANGTLY